MTQPAITPLEALKRATALADTYAAQHRDDIQNRYAERLAVLQHDHDEQVRAAHERFAQAETTAQSRVADVVERLKYTAASWSASAWAGYPLEMPARALNGSLRAGTLLHSFPQFGIDTLPLLIPLLDVGHIVIVSQGSAKARARAVLRSLVARAVLQLAAAGGQFHFVDPIAVGANFPFNTLPESVRGARVISESDEIDQAMKAITNAVRDDTRSAPLILCAADFPVRWSKDALMRLETVASAGVLKQVYAILHIDQSRAQQDGVDLDSIMHASSIITVGDDAVTAQIQGMNYTFDPDEPPSVSLLNSLLSALASRIST
ncbi:MAG: hypothetical protein SF123_08710 [Chloroflexota bacterium]|nr:hypothetical protein [Chloroflexota bacterium]